MVQRPFLGILAAAVIIAAGCGPAEDTDSGDHITFDQEIKGGQIDRDSTAVVGLYLATGAICSGSLIAPNLILTAQHCVASVSDQILCGRTPFGSTYGPGNIFVTTNTSFGRSGYHEVAEVVTGAKSDICGNDIALLVLKDNISPTEAVPMVPRIDYPTYRGEVYTAIGYGLTSGNGNDSGVRRIKEGLRIECEGSECPNGYGIYKTEFLGSDGTCQGDSGGPAIDSKGRVLGALSRGGGDCQFSTYSAVAGWSDLIIEYGLKAAERGGYEPPFWATYGVSEIPENDLDLDGVFADVDNCPEVANPDQADIDGDGQGDLCDNNSDTDEVEDDADNCPLTDNGDQVDTDGDGFGDACDDDDDDDGVADGADFCPTNPKFADYGANCSITGDDLVIVKAADKGCSTAGNASGSLAGALMMLGLFWRPRRRR